MKESKVLYRLSGHHIHNREVCFVCAVKHAIHDELAVVQLEPRIGETTCDLCGMPLEDVVAVQDDET